MAGRALAAGRAPCPYGGDRRARLRTSRTRAVSDRRAWWMGAQNAGGRGDRTRDVIIVRAPVADADAHDAAAAPGASGKERLAGGVDRVDHLIGAAIVIGLAGTGSRIAEPDQRLVDD